MLRKRLTSHPRSSSVRYSSMSLLYISVREPVGRIPRSRSSRERTVFERRRLKSMICCKAGDGVMFETCWGFRVSGAASRYMRSRWAVDAC